MAKDDKKRQALNKRKIRANQVVSGLADGKNTTEIAEDLGISRSAVSVALNSKEAAEIIKRSDDRLTKLIDKICDRFELILERGLDADVIKIGLPILRTKKIINEAQEHIVSLPKPTVITWKDTKVFLGIKQEDDEDDQA